jgi:hypothetical protein
MGSTVDSRPREVRQQAQQHAGEARTRMEARRRQHDEGLTGWLNKRAGEWDLSGQDEATMQRQKPPCAGSCVFSGGAQQGL